MEIRWGSLLIMVCGLYARGSCKLQEQYFTEGEEGTITFSQALDKPPEAYKSSLQHADKEHPFYIQFGVGDADGRFDTNNLKSPDQRDRMSVSFEMRRSVLMVNVLVSPIMTSDTAIYLLTVAERGSKEPLLVFAAVVYVLPSIQGGKYFEHTDTDDSLPSRCCTLAYTVALVKDWRRVRFSVLGERGATFYCYNIYPSPGVFITGHMFDMKDLYYKTFIVNIGTRYYCCMDYQDQVRCEYYELGNNGKLTLTNVTRQDPDYTPFRKPCTLPPTDDASQTTTKAQSETEDDQTFIGLSDALIISITFNVLMIMMIVMFLALMGLWYYGVRHRSDADKQNSSESSSGQSELDENKETSKLRRRPKSPQSFILSNQDLE